ncbi:MAG: sigma-70 family RNA polymerase sigma factor [Bryobacterales bacterium]|nr:sigma-70 family RNA polymerase sigma factor [Bryobacterales bacterium]
MIDEIESHRRAITGHCYRMLASAVDAEDAAQETLIRAWKAMDKFDGRSTLRTWLFRIATNVCLDELAARGRRARPMEERPPGFRGDLTQHPREYWIEPIPDARAVPDADPLAQLQLRQSIRLAFVAALQNLAPRQRATLLLTEVLGWSAAEVAETLATSIPAVNSALQRARAATAQLTPAPAELTPAQSELLEKYVAAFERYDVDEMASLLRDDAAFSMPPYALWLQGPAQVREWLNGHGAGCRGSRLIPVAACGSPAFAQYRADPAGGHSPWAIVVLELDQDRIAGWNSFLDTATLFPLFGLPQKLSSNR